MRKCHHMTALTVSLPNSVHQKVKEQGERDRISVNQFIASAAAEKVSAVLTLDYLRNEAALGCGDTFLRYLDMAPVTPAVNGDACRRSEYEPRPSLVAYFYSGAVTHSTVH
jgi:hypothetical protein